METILQPKWIIVIFFLLSIIGLLLALYATNQSNRPILYNLISNLRALKVIIFLEMILMFLITFSVILSCFTTLIIFLDISTNASKIEYAFLYIIITRLPALLGLFAYWYLVISYKKKHIFDDIPFIIKIFLSIGVFYSLIFVIGTILSNELPWNLLGLFFVIPSLFALHLIVLLRNNTKFSLTSHSKGTAQSAAP